MRLLYICFLFFSFCGTGNAQSHNDFINLRAEQEMLRDELERNKQEQIKRYNDMQFEKESEHQDSRLEIQNRIDRQFLLDISEPLPKNLIVNTNNNHKKITRSFDLKMIPSKILSSEELEDQLVYTSAKIVDLQQKSLIKFDENEFKKFVIAGRNEGLSVSDMIYFSNIEKLKLFEIERLAHTGNPKAQYIFGMRHIVNLFVIKNVELGLYWVNEAAINKYPEAKQFMKELNQKILN